MHLWDLASRRQLGDPLAGFTGGIAGNGVNAVAFSADGDTVTASGVDGTARSWDVASHEQIGDALSGGTGIRWASFSATGDTLAASSDDGTVSLWNTASHARIGAPERSRQRRHHVDRLQPGRAAPGRRWSLQQGAAVVQVWEAASHARIAELHPDDADGSDHFASAAVSRDGQLLATGGDHGTVRLWDAESRAPIGDPLPGFTGARVMSLAFSPDGASLAAGAEDGTARLWDVASRVPIGSTLSRDHSVARLQPRRPHSRHQHGKVRAGSPIVGCAHDRSDRRRSLCPARTVTDAG